MAYQLKDDVRTWQLIRETATRDPDQYVRQEALELLSKWHMKDPATGELFREAASKDRAENVRRTAITLLTTGQKDDLATWRLIRETAMKDPEASLRSRAFVLLLRAANCDELHQKMMSRNLDGKWSDSCDPTEPVTSRRVAYVAHKLDLSIDEVHRQYEAIADRLQIALDLEWRKPN
jgi:hypothetical protein